MSDRLAPRLHHRLAGLLPTPGWRRVALLRRVAAAGLVTLALVLALAPGAGVGGVPLVVVAADLPAGSTLSAADLTLRDWPADLAPAGALREVAAAEGRVLAGAARAGEPVTDVRLAGAGPAVALAGGPDAAAVPVRLADAGVAGLLTPGSRVDVVTPGARADEPVVLAADAVVLAVLPAESTTAGRLVMVAMPRGLASRVAAASLSEQVAVTLR
ncbi:SAF domain-containing protein [Pseudonocardia nigra]|uniref:SAF domain-containing protein n=1 Tax=Pseudonocardia nigra TaxID=1921578 RepID=UPI001C5D41F8|nr:SAF domain-containing protein [Pseudonocardia nigra]